ncbi:hypothetical protein Tco_1340784 [Tanacetum coccineum]
MERAATTTTTSLDAEPDSGIGPRRQDTILGDILAQTRFERLSKQSNDPPLSRVNTLGSGKDKESQEVGKEEKGKNSTTQEEGSAPITTAGVSVSTAEPSTPPTTILIEDEDLTIAQTLMKMKSEKSKEKLKEKSKEKGVSSETAIRSTRGVTMQEPSESGTRKIVPPP